VTDPQGNSSWAVAEIRVINLPPTAVITGPHNPMERHYIHLEGRYSFDVDNDAIVQYMWYEVLGLGPYVPRYFGAGGHPIVLTVWCADDYPKHFDVDRGHVVIHSTTVPNTGTR